VRKDGPSQFRRATTILAGDWAYLKALRPALELRNFRILDLLIDTSKELVEADLLESGADGDGGNDSRADPHPRWACLFSMSSQLGAVLANVGPIWERQLAEYGFRIAVAWSLKRIMEAPEIPVLRNRAVSEAEVCLQPFPESSHKQSLARLAAYLRSGGASQSPLAASPLRTYSAGL